MIYSAYHRLDTSKLARFLQTLPKDLVHTNRTFLFTLTHEYLETKDPRVRQANFYLLDSHFHLTEYAQSASGPMSSMTKYLYKTDATIAIFHHALELGLHPRNSRLYYLILVQLAHVCGPTDLVQYYTELRTLKPNMLFFRALDILMHLFVSFHDWRHVLDLLHVISRHRLLYPLPEHRELCSFLRLSTPPYSDLVPLSTLLNEHPIDPAKMSTLLPHLALLHLKTVGDLRAYLQRFKTLSSSTDPSSPDACLALLTALVHVPEYLIRFRASFLERPRVHRRLKFSWQ